VVKSKKKKKNKNGKTVVRIKHAAPVSGIAMLSCVIPLKN